MGNGEVRELVSSSPDMIGPAAFSQDGSWVTAEWALARLTAI